MFGIALVSGAALLHGYVFWRASSVPALRRAAPPRAWAAAGLLAFLAFAAAFRIGHGDSGRLAAAVERLGLDWISALFIAAVCLFAAEMPPLLAPPLRPHSPALRGVALSAAAVLSAFASWQGSRPPVVEELRVTLPGLPRELDGTVVTALSDLHLGGLLDEEWLAGRAEQVRSTRPDLVVLLGDVFEGHGSPGKGLVEGLRALSAPMGLYAVPGNHDRPGRGGAAAALEAAGVEVLAGRWEEVRPGLVLAGVEDLTALRRSGGDTARAVEESLAGRPPGGTVLLSHTPWESATAARAGAGLLLAGHTHGGQVWPFGLAVRLFYPLLDGEYDVEGMKVAVSRGAGTWGARMRLWRPSQILRITLSAPLPPPPPSLP